MDRHLPTGIATEMVSFHCSWHELFFSSVVGSLVLFILSRGLQKKDMCFATIPRVGQFQQPVCSIESCLTHGDRTQRRGIDFSFFYVGKP